MEVLWCVLSIEAAVRIDDLIKLFVMVSIYKGGGWVLKFACVCACV
jgi:hypothetical protein